VKCALQKSTLTATITQSGSITTTMMTWQCCPSNPTVVILTLFAGVIIPNAVAVAIPMHSVDESYVRAVNATVLAS
jgi:hypothetical protein